MDKTDTGPLLQFTIQCRKKNLKDDGSHTEPCACMGRAQLASGFMDSLPKQALSGQKQQGGGSWSSRQPAGQLLLRDPFGTVRDTKP